MSKVKPGDPLLELRVTDENSGKIAAAMTVLTVT